MHIHLGRVAFGVGEGDFVAFLHQGANRNRQFVEIVASALVTSAIFQRQATTARDQYQDFSFCCHIVLLLEHLFETMRPSEINRGSGRAGLYLSSHHFLNLAGVRACLTTVPLTSVGLFCCTCMVKTVKEFTANRCPNSLAGTADDS